MDFEASAKKEIDRLYEKAGSAAVYIDRTGSRKAVKVFWHAERAKADRGIVVTDEIVIDVRRSDAEPKQNELFEISGKTYRLMLPDGGDAIEGSYKAKRNVLPG